MKRLFASILAAIGASAATAAPPTSKVVGTVPIDSIRYSMPTVALDAVDFTMPTPSSFEGAPQFHEDEWGQLEFFSGTRLDEVKEILKALKLFEASSRTQYGWNKIFQRKILRSPIEALPTNFSVTQGVKARPAPILTTSSRPLGQVKNGFSIELGKNAYLYGLKVDGHITVLGASLQGADDMLLADTFSNLNKKYGLILVDWRQQFVLVAVDKNGKFKIWRP
jgi:hypothetical protein